MAELLYRLGRACARRARTVIAVWLALLAAAGAAYVLYAGELEDSFSIPGTPTDEVNRLLSEKFSDMGGGAGIVVYQTEDGSAFTHDQREAIAERAERAAEVSGVADAVDPFAAESERADQRQELADGREELDAAMAELESGQEELDQAREQAEAAGLLAQAQAQFDAEQAEIDEGRETLEAEYGRLEQGEAMMEMAEGIRTVSEDGDTALVNVSFTEDQMEVSQETRAAVMEVFSGNPVPGTEVDFNSDLARTMPTLVSPAEVIGVIVAGVVLVVMLGTLLGAALPIVTALVGVGVATLTAMSLSGVVEMASVTPILGLMLGLAIGIDYALFIVNRHRRQLKEGVEVAESIGLAAGTAGNAVVFAGTTVLIALLGLNLIGIGFLGLMGSIGALALAVAVLVAVTLVPALLALLGHRVLARRERARLAERTPAAAEEEAAARQPRPMPTGRALAQAGAAVAALVVIALPALDLRLGMPDGSSEPTHSTQYQAHTAVEENFGAGQNGTLLVAARLTGGPTEEAAERNAQREQAEIAEEIYSFDDVAAVAPIGVSDDHTTAIFQVVPVDGPASASTEDLVHSLRDLEPIEGTGPLGVAGVASGNIDISETLSGALPTYLAVVVGLSLVILLLVFRSVFVPVVATLGFILSFFAALGGVVAVYQWGWLGGLIGVENTGPVLNFLPTLLVGILFGLAMDYMLFIGTGMREAYVHGAPARTAVVQGFRAGRAVVTAAAVIMISVFGGFVFSETVMISSIGFALAFGVLIDAFVVRMVLVPALMHLAGDAAWWLPRRLDRLLPDIDVEGAALERRHQRPKPPRAAPTAEADRPAQDRVPSERH
ncbi:MMPL family transporter [Streptomonospora nanhaiensis]|uniref:RND superfamily putative drug exporter n=1 Tax=Streptomonospora nanhaiensis TaxID=1323731 RepID=A0A853BKT6_9ACTN|nr:MMPL family transporter [Streptomonospora nanhaiensis]MBV2364188.1 MMPL family transporter [Streptomonospora nanhaiensis]MBX9386692.1 MMPL family transporter [Streptomonospora nanhaiensis]NYI95142.1 RND superfamily putative drug exporter [Streptomonospora nanhaiensis]